MKKIISFFSILLLAVSVAYPKGDSEYVSFTAQSELISSDAGTHTHRVTVSVTYNIDVSAGVQFKFVLPDGMSLAQEQVNYTGYSLYEAANGALQATFKKQSDGYYWSAIFFDNNYSIFPVSAGTYTIGYFDVVWNTDSENQPVIDFSNCLISDTTGYSSYYDDPFSITLQTDEDPAVTAGLCPNSNHPHIIDMGDAGKWACCNVGASTPWENGGYYAWGETEEKEGYDWSTYIHCDGSEDSCHDLGSNISGTQYDVAHVKWGGKWCMPSNQQIHLLENCSSEWTELNGINGRKFTAPNGGTIFLPAAGGRYRYNDPDDVYSDGSYWSSSQCPSPSYYAYFLQFGSDFTRWYGSYRRIGRSVRPVIDQSESLDPAVESGLCPDSNHPHVIDMGDAGKWACCNVGASAPWEYGGYYAWGETEEKESYSWNNYIHCDGSYDTCHDLGEDIAGTDYDVAHVKWGGEWCMPSRLQQDNLILNCSSEWISLNGVFGRKYVSPDGGAIFLPAAGYIRYGESMNINDDGNYWSSTPYAYVDNKNSQSAFYLNFNNQKNEWYFTSRNWGRTVRPVIYELESDFEPEPEDPASLCPDENHPHIIDMGEAGKWACCNVGANAPWEYGGYYAWGETEEKDNYSVETYIHCDGSYENFHNLGSDIAGTQYDVAYVKWGNMWCLPSVEQIKILLNHCNNEWRTVNGIKGIKFTAPNGRTIFLPAAASYNSDDVGFWGYYWSSTQIPNELYYAYSLNFNPTDSYWSSTNTRNYGFSVRPIISEKTENERYLLLSHEENGVTYSLYKLNDKNDTRVNGDGWTFYKSELTLEVTIDDNTQSYLVSNDLYLCEGDGQPMCMALDFNTRTIHLFTNSKHGNGSYSMNGYYFVSPLDNINFSEEQIFNSENWGWMPYFTYTNGKLELQHFNFAVYSALTSAKNDNGDWSTECKESIYPSDFEARWREIGPVLVIGTENDYNISLSATTEILYVGDEQSVLTISMDNDFEVLMTEFFLHLPQGVEIATASDGYYDVTLNPERISDHTLEIAKNGNGIYHFLCYSPTNKPISGNTGELIFLNLTFDSNIDSGIYEGAISNILIGNKQLKGIEPDDVTFQMEFAGYTMGDVNNDTRINGVDVVEIVNNILGRPSIRFIMKAADFDGNMVINGMDLIEEIDLVMAQMETQAVKPRHVKAENQEAAEGVLQLYRNNDNELSMAILSDDQFTLSQFVLQLNDGQTLDNLSADGAHTIVFRRLSDNRYAVLCYSIANKPFVTNDNILTMSISGEGTVTVTDALFVTDNMQELYVNTASTELATGITEINNSLSAPADIYSISGALIKKNTKSVESLPKGIYIINGKKYIKR